MLCDIVRKQSRETWKTLRTANKLACHVGEESITDFLILALAKGSLLGGYTAKAFTKPQEALNGADWELWLTGPSHLWFGYRIQAKKIHVAALAYPHLHPAPKPGKLTQVQKLINAAALVNAVPIYALYSYWPKNPAAPAWSCGTYAVDNQLWGIAAVPAATIATLSPTNKLSALSAHMTVFQCLVCCGGYGGSDLPTRAHAFAKQRIADNATLRESPPSHVALLLEQQLHLDQRGVEPSGEALGDLSRVVVLEQRGEG